jgi:hypothetical protein
MFTQLRNCAANKSKLFVLAGASLLAAQLASSQAQSAPLADAFGQLQTNRVSGELIPVGGLRSQYHARAGRYGHQGSGFAYTGIVPRYRYSFLDGNYEGEDYHPPQPHYFSHRYNWWPPLATFRYPDGPWYAW